ncbi:sterol desaturase/sphingolipid hydroxylase (fatty acid hydroxylase superfamily) [Saonia flava]|uniref:Sterol desaturase/sphingolipid hydroxylase (Fatty acid hydroxylase superfamily) n=1 Tax=Saonia flava TaxID=523696 RepID=A0A846QNQ2_9FLAO|nr:sterol desaturase family protein [Saonia flava]NJB69711.1 sterol desaturase/sphingolipid hydroxylase (fatty acid hydroxylase superfamily) [Saonia flava]
MESILNNLPNPIDLLLDPISLIVLGIYGALMAWEAIFPARKLPKIKNWKLRGMVSFAIFFYLSSYLPMIWDVYLADYQIFDLTALGTGWGAFASIMLYELALYGWHWSMHKSDTLWKVFHQMHHSAERMDSYGAFYFSPMDMIGFTFLGSLCLVVVAGFTPEATTLFILGTTFLAIFQHSNIKTPRWIGYLIQRPEAHAIHHAKGIHAYNYSDISLYDILFGTFNNPSKYEHEAGFYHGASEKVWDMLKFKDISNEDVSTEKKPNLQENVMH